VTAEQQYEWNRNFDACRNAFERYASTQWNVGIAELTGFGSDGRWRYPNPIIDQHWQFFVAGWDSRQRLVMEGLGQQ
jgi:hypothetical protein